jgi:hypothetical protein
LSYSNLLSDDYDPLDAAIASLSRAQRECWTTGPAVRQLPSGDFQWLDCEQIAKGLRYATYRRGFSNHEWEQYRLTALVGYPATRWWNRPFIGRRK